MATTINKKINHIFLLLEKLANGLELYAQDEQLQEELFGNNSSDLKDPSKANERSLRRYLDDIHTLYNNIIVTEKKQKEFADRKVTIYRTTDKSDVSDVLKFFIEQKSDLTWVIQLLHEQDPALLQDLESSTKAAVENELKEDEDIFIFSSKPFEILDSQEQKSVFSSLKQAVKNHEYRTIHFVNPKSNTMENVKCLKMIYSQNNWYVAVETEENKLQLIRIQFISRVAYSHKSNYQKSALLKYKEYFANFENPMTLAGIKQKKAVLKATSRIAKYFEKDMKPFFKSQEYIRTNEDNSVEFSINYTQDLEILPFIKGWLPAMQILSPESLKEHLRDDLKYAVDLLK